MIRYPDAHTHIARELPCEFDLLSIELPAARQLDEHRCYSVGLHPWSNPAGWTDGIAQLEQWLPLPQVRAVGECGLDKRRGALMEMQTSLFVKQIRLAVGYKKPLILHNYKATGEILELHAKYGDDVPWILHGFRANVHVMEMFLKKGFYLSYGIHFNEEALLKTPLTHLLLETDEASELELKGLYARVATLLKMDVAELVELIKKNMRSLFSM